MRKDIKLKVVLPLAVLTAILAGSANASAPLKKPTFYGSSSSSISSGVVVPEGAMLYTSGTVPPMLNKDGKTAYERYGDTKTQGIGILKELEKQLTAQGLSLKDVVYLRVYIAEDPAKNGAYDYSGWFEAYSQFFNNAANPVKPARSTVGVAGLVNSDWLIEIEAVAAYPEDHS